MDDFRRFFFRGLAALVPTLLTIAILIWSYNLVHNYVGMPITGGLLRVCQRFREEPPPTWINPQADSLTYGTPIDEWDETGRRLTIEYKAVRYGKASVTADGRKLNEHVVRARNDALWRIVFRKWKLHLVGFVIAILLVYFVGYFLASLVGRRTWRAGEGLLNRMPLIRTIYPHVKQVTDFLLAGRKVEASGVVAVQYPRKGVWSVGLRTGAPLGIIQRAVDEELVTVFIPSSPTPVTGYVIQVPRSDVIELNMTIDEGLRFTISGGVIKPEAVLLEPDRSVSEGGASESDETP